ncbi:mannosyl-3-phosphoglycerate synthase [Pelagicoccus sp. SDUM812003]|uniref:mannosyl-3-phosphoglycerate synthase n=1 Tax=Pelagicoccus sp. SDUM812003 TaxID=3041267 RepID=UPI00280CF55D|nr:mannosyl-3-phosphoglycerate synthase [Pelagicoccus sp. SDUM812003]MDQ8203157.1 mannosyl-3-phosphoglycerate synthase [Pelagicoccus sp. SDUM812003]
MRLEIPRECERVGAVQIYGLQKVYELDGGSEFGSNSVSKDGVIRRIPSEALYERQRKMAIVVPVKNERLKLIEGVLVGIPHPCQIIVVSNSPRGPVDRFQIEKEAITNFCKFTNKKVTVVHQKDAGLAKAIELAGYTELLGDDGLVRSGKAEGMIMGTLIAKWLDNKYIGFVDSDNYFPGAVHEYVQEYAAGFEMFDSDNTFVRISWNSKPKVMENSIFFAKWGRSSVHSNRTLNRLLTHFSGYETEVVKTGNAGEHALTLDLALNIEYASGYAVETHHFMNLLEMWGGILPVERAEELRGKVTICQIESRNPHMHESKGEEHVEDMIDASLSVIYNSPLCPELLKREIAEERAVRLKLEKPEPVPPVKVYSNLSNLNLNVFLEHCDTAFHSGTESLSLV